MATSGSTRTTLISPFQYFADPTRARPIFNGFIFIGRVDGDPTNTADQIPVQVIRESGGPVTVAQPIRTGPGGLPIYNGSPAQIVVCRSNYSLTLQDNNRVQVYHSPNVQSGFVNQPITHTTLAAAMADDNSSRQLIRLLERGGAEFRRAVDQAEYDRFPELGRFTDAGSILWVLIVSGNVVVENLGAIGDYSFTSGTGTDNTSAINQAGQLAALLKVPVEIRLMYLCMGDVTFSSKANIVGLGKGRFSDNFAGSYLVFGGSAKLTLMGNNPRGLLIKDVGFAYIGTQTGISNIIFQDFSLHTSSIVRVEFYGSTTHAVKFSGARSANYSQNVSLTDTTFYSCAGAMSTSDVGNLVITLLTMTNINIDGTRPNNADNAHLWDMRGVREVNITTILNEGNLGSVPLTSEFNFEFDRWVTIRGIHSEWVGSNQPQYLAVLNATSGLQGIGGFLTIEDGIIRRPIKVLNGRIPIILHRVDRFLISGESNTTEDYIDVDSSLNGVWAGARIIGASNRIPMTVSASHIGKVVVESSFQVGGTVDLAQRTSVPTRMYEWKGFSALENASTNPLITTLTKLRFGATSDQSTPYGSAFRVTGLDGDLINTPRIIFGFTVGTEYAGSQYSVAVKYRIVSGGGDATLTPIRSVLSNTSNSVDRVSRGDGFTLATLVSNVPATGVAGFEILRHITGEWDSPPVIDILGVELFMGSSVPDDMFSFF